MRLGVHISGVGKIHLAFARAEELGCETMQIFARNPQQWRHNTLSAEEVREFNRRRRVSKIHPVFIHVPYLINLASPRIHLYQASVQAYIEDLEEAAALRADYIVTHMGSHKETSEEEGLLRFTRALRRIIAKTKHSKVGILLENTSGSGSWLGSCFRHHQQIINALHAHGRVGVCVDTAHAYVAGYDLATAQGLAALIKEIDALVGIESVKLIHLNDAKDLLGSHRDRHEHIGEGKIGIAGMRRIVNHPALAHCSFILETPKDSDDADEKNLRRVRALRRT